MHNLPYNGRAPLLVSASMMRTVRFASVFLAAVAFAGAAFGQQTQTLRGPFIVKDLTQDFTSDVSVQDAITQGRDRARVVAAQRLIERFTLPEDLSSAAQPVQAADLAAARPILRTQAREFRLSQGGKHSYRQDIAYEFNADIVRKYFEDRRVPFVETQASKALLVPSTTGGLNPADWGAAWTEGVFNAQGQETGKKVREDLTVLTPYVASSQAWPRRPSFLDVQNEITATGADHAVVAEAYSQGGQYYVRIIDLRTGAADTSSNVVGPFASLPAARDGAVAEMERAWKAQSIIRTSGSSNVKLTAAFRNFDEWVRIKKAVEASRLVTKDTLDIESVSQQGADLSFTYAGRPDQLQSDLRSRGVALSGTDGGWVLQVASQ
jgi:hypothetical protein